MISIIIPVYNSEKRLEECLNSVSNQNYKDFEVVLIDDGSTDNSPSICKTFCSKDARFSYYRTENHGVSHARNFGLSKATRKYGAFNFIWGLTLPFNFDGGVLQ